MSTAICVLSFKNHPPMVFEDEEIASMVAVNPNLKDENPRLSYYNYDELSPLEGWKLVLRRDWLGILYSSDESEEEETVFSDITNKG